MGNDTTPKEVKKVRDTITFQPTEKVRKALSKITKGGYYRGLQTSLINEAILKTYGKAQTK